MTRSAELLLTTRQFGRPMLSVCETGSTNTDTLRLATEGAPHGLVLSAESQIAGRGRQGRTWETPPGTNLTFSVVIRPTFETRYFGLITTATSLAVAEATDELAASTLAAIKWPNDILLEGKKACGMLLESTMRGSLRAGEAAVVLGVGLNVNQDRFSPDLENTATSLFRVFGKEFDRGRMLATILNHLERRYRQLEAGEIAVVVEAYRTRLSGLGTEVTLRYMGSDRRIEGRIEGIDDTGGLLLKTTTGIQVFHAGEVTTNPRQA